MKEATGELNMTVITVVAIAAIAAIFYTFVWPQIRANINRQTNCSNAFNCNTSACATSNGQATGTMSCQYYAKPDDTTPTPISCPCK